MFRFESAVKICVFGFCRQLVEVVEEELVQGSVLLLQRCGGFVRT